MKTSHFLSNSLMLVISFVLFSCKPSVNELSTDWNVYGLKGRVKELHQWKYIADYQYGELIKKQLIDSTIIYFNDNGKIERRLFEEINSPIGSVSGEEIFTYHDNMCISEKHTYTYWNNRTELEKHITINDDYGDPIRYTIFNAAGQETYRTEYIYTDNRRLREVAIYYKNELQSKKKFFEYDDQGMIKKYVEYDQNGLFDTHLLAYDLKGNILTYTITDDEGKIIRETSYTYNDESLINKQIEHVTIDKREDITNYSYKYDQHGNFIVKNITSEMEKTIVQRVIIYY